MSGPSFTAVQARRVNAAEWEYHYVPRERNGIGFLYMHGAGGTHAQSQEHTKGIVKLMHRLAGLGYYGISGDWGGTHTFGNDTSMARMDVGRQLLIDEGCDGRIILIGASMGNVLAMRYAADHPDRVRGMVGIIPLIDLPQVRAENVSGMAATIEAAWGLGPADEIPARGRLHERVAEMTSVPWLAYYGTADTVTRPEEIVQMVAALGDDSAAYVMDNALEHSDPLMAKTPWGDIVNWVSRRH